MKPLGVALLAACAWSAQAAEGDAARGRALVASREQGLCLLCHAAPIAEQRQQGNLAPDLAGVASRLTPQQLRQRMTEPRAGSMMPVFGPTAGLQHVGERWRDKPIFDAQQLEDVLAYLQSLK
ncbi:c-type cytochrome [Pelomonas sp. SE-A7]|uniref:c-type cytochrome n=1 Tax=Pelomonas sp. SE-A7 TaxID=3054953 RepID=UPI00259C9BE4|nr:c-type cytochrome [Pelomonas sp. SE-A7]MDM4767818.1 c-type cytochrome [Pelomonas sp. SE-A7]